MVDIITHTAISLSFGYLLKGYSDTKSDHFIIPLVIGAILPDLDYFFKLIGIINPIISHRGFMHSFIGIIPIVLILSLLWVPEVIRKTLDCKYWEFLVLIYIGAILHFGVDMLGTPIMIFFPFTFEMDFSLELLVTYQYLVVFGIIGSNFLFAKLWGVTLFQKQPYPNIFCIFVVIAFIILYIAIIIWCLILNQYRRSIVITFATIYYVLLFLMFLPNVISVYKRKVAEQNI